MLNILACQIGNANMGSDPFSIIPQITVLFVNAIKIAIPVILIIFGIIDLAKAVMTNDEKEMKGAQSKLIKRVIYAVLVFLIIAIVQLIFGAIGDTANSGEVDANTIRSCISCFVSDTGAC